MLKRTSRIGFILLALVFVASLILVTGCRRGPDLRGARVIMASWGNAYDVDTYVPRNEDEEIQLEFRRRLLADNNLEMRSIELAGWEDYFPIVTSNIMAGSRDVQMYRVGADWAMTLHRQGLLAPLNQGSVRLNNRIPVGLIEDANNAKGAWNKMMEDLFTFNGVQYAASPGIGGDSWQGNFVFWNKRLLREAGFDPEAPYDMQRDRTWTWDAFRTMLRATTRDLTGDGLTDVFGMPSGDPREVMYAFIYGNNGNFVTIDANGRFHNATSRPEFIEAMQFKLDLIEEGVMLTPPDNAAWDWDFTAFVDGRVAFLIAPEWRKGMMPDSMIDDYGCVLPPMGPRANAYRMSLTEVLDVVPAFYSPEEVDIILRAVDLWNTPASTEWQGGHYWAFRDRRAVDESVAMTKYPDQRYVTYRNFAMIPGFDTGELVWDMWQFQGNPAQLVEQIAPRWNALIDEMNR